MKTASFRITCPAALALMLLAGVVLAPRAATAGSMQNHGDYGGTWFEIAPSYRDHWREVERYYRAPVYVGPNYAYGPTYYDPDFFGPPIYADDGPGFAFVAPDAGLFVDVD
jgi:hypothetical protein